MLLLVPTALFWDQEHSVFWKAMAFLGFLQVTALVLNMLPVPGLDGYGVLEPHLSPQTQRALEPAKQWGLIVLIVLLFTPQLNRWFFELVFWFVELSGVPRGLAVAGMDLVPLLVRLVLTQALATYACLRIDCRYGCRPRSRLEGHPGQPDGHRRGDPDRLLRARADHRAVINSIALLADAGHMLTDLVAMFMGLTAVLLARHGSASPARTYGWHRAEVFTAVANAVLLLGVAAFILYEAFERLGDAPEVPGVPMIVVALAGLVANAVVVLLLRSHSESSLAVKGAYMEVVADTVGSIGVLIAGIVTVTTRWPYADVVVAVFVALWVLPRAIALARAALRILSESSPTHIDVEELRTALCARRGRDRGARPARVDAGAGQGHGDRAPDQHAGLGSGARRCARGADRARARPRHRSGGAARWRRRLQVRSRTLTRRQASPSAGRRGGIAVVEQIQAALILVALADRVRGPRQRGHTAQEPAVGFVAVRNRDRNPSIRCGATDPVRGDSRCVRTHRR